MGERGGYRECTCWKYQVEVLNDYKSLPNKPIIFAANHSAFPDTPIGLKAIGKHSYVFIGKQHLDFLDELFFLLNGAIWVNRKKKEDMAASKEGLLAYLQKGKSVLWFPEATWNLTKNQMIMHMKWGIIEIAQKADAQIIPMVLHYDREEMVCTVQFGSSMAGQDLDNKAEAVLGLRDAMATLLWERMSEQQVICRAEVEPEQLEKEMYRVLEEYPPLNWEYEKSCIFEPYRKLE